MVQDQHFHFPLRQGEVQLVNLTLFQAQAVISLEVKSFQACAKPCLDLNYITEPSQESPLGTLCSEQNKK